MKTISLEIRENMEDKSDIPKQIYKPRKQDHTKSTHYRVHRWLNRDQKEEVQKLRGYGIHVTTNSHFPIHTGGGTVRSDGNNFVAEMAAATIVIKALPPNRTLSMYVDSVAAIQALQEGLISERKRIKAQGRAWKSVVRPIIAKKKDQIAIHHVKSPSGLENPEQQGNDYADRMAKKFMNQAEDMDPPP